MNYRVVLVTGLAGVGVAGHVMPLLAAENVMTAPTMPAASPAGFGVADKIDYVKVLPAPPVAGSRAAAADLAAVRQAQVDRTEEQIAWAKLVDGDVIFNQASVLGPWFAAERLPRTTEFFKKLEADIRAVDGAAKKPFLRPRPMTLDPSIKPCVRLPTSTSYPSGSAVQSYVWAELLADAVPAKRLDLGARARRAALSRVVGGVHFPSDVESGKTLAAAVVAELKRNPAFREEWAAVRTEIAAAQAAP
jgi:acid phosphatase (class A)